MLAKQRACLGPSEAPVTPLTQKRELPGLLGWLVRRRGNRIGERLEASGDLAEGGGYLFWTFHAFASYQQLLAIA
jgi:hypothetical protein